MLAIAGGKGGCGKTTTAVGLTEALARRGASPLLVDADSDMPDVHHATGIDRTTAGVATTQTEAAGVDALANGTRLRAAVTTVPSRSGIAVLTGGSRENLSTALRGARRWQGPVLVDCAAGATPVATRPLRHATQTLVVTTDRVQCVEDARSTAVTAKQLGAPLVGTVVRETADGTVDPRLLDESVLSTVPTVARDPLEHPVVQQRLQAVVGNLPVNPPGLAAEHIRQE